MYSTSTGVVSRHPVAAFVLVTLAFSWGVWFGGDRLDVSPTAVVLLGAWGPTVGALVVTWRLEGVAGVRRLLGRFVQFGVPARWLALAVLLPFVLAGIAALGALALGESVVPTLPGGAPLFFLPVVFIVNVFVGGPIAEELGWRGFAVPRLRGRYGVVGSGLLVGVVWAAWHAPFYLLPGSSVVVGGFPFAWFAVVVVAYSVLFSWLVTGAGDSVVPAVLFHAGTNTAAGSLGLVPTDSIVALALYALVLYATVGGVALTSRRRTERHPAPT
ncbi:CPBP family intramembrane glutamic endopeptidase [Halorarius litoreus]|uniref:CPBP family intramembrane glutamic endopeptidase n=1 Tax=Halorarius litoreus TaxID=2962676 RepID=UPI0020CD1862|nr:type II CAAX endopeptidase family protein [Halorarius litoreus]